MASFTQLLIASDPAGYQRATQSPFLRRAAEGTLRKAVLGRWLANDRLYIHGYVRAAGLLLSLLPLPEVVAVDSTTTADPESELLAWTVDALVNIQREASFFVSTAARYGLDVNLPIDASTGRVPPSAKLEGLRRFEALFDGLRAGGEEQPLPWLEAAVVFYATERCYLDAWTWAKGHLDEGKDGSGDEDGGAVRCAFIANWTDPGFVAFVDRLGAIIDGAVKAQGETVAETLRKRGLVKWREVLAAEEAFWPSVDE
ncbi:heme oxygenase-like, multi-helical [Cordyceps fumosorosea ARSEF 2679]|uniref:Heme oxygenase-like, multi-helical n=1 Tax=Cordyceps fumosorosea (strain ARSEF 2679) TaxID=1081104 RepID=A0A167WH49_CORFA|nr:heme oxygenase-like, multi-helical [Cordyceps fumosorosea ARSEF 2679]OAA63783.1 heme oxygenase-like, multi-helical [Cordyceps fumosorosea ARSEF 2679]